MRIQELVGSMAEAVERNTPDAFTKSSSYVTAAFTKIAEPVKSGGSAAFAKIDHTVRTIRLRRPVPVEEVNATPVKNGCTNSGGAAFSKIRKAVATPVMSSRSYGFVTLAKIGYTIRVKGVYRIVPWISEDAETIISVYPTSFPQNPKLHESDDDDKLIHGQDVGMPTFARIGYIVRVKGLYTIGQWMADPETKARIKKYINILANNAHNHLKQHNYKFVHVEADFFIILARTLVDISNEHNKLSKEKAGSQEQHLSGSQDIVGVIPLTKFLVFMAKEFEAFSNKEPFRSRIFSKGLLTMESLAFMMREFFVFMMKQFFGAQVFSHIDDIIVAVMRELFGIELVNESGFHGSATQGKNKKGMHKYYCSSKFVE